MPELVAVVDEVTIYPVKSMTGQRVPERFVGYSGFVGDRVIAATNAAGQAVTAKPSRDARLLDYRATIENGEIWAYCPTGQFFRWDDDRLEASLREHLGHDVRLVPMTGGLLVRPTNFKFELRPGVGYDSSPVHLLTDASLTACQNLTPDSLWVPGRFRPNLMLKVESGLVGFVEDGWVGQKLTFSGGLVLGGRKRAERCVLTTRGHAAAGLPADGDILRTLHAHHSDLLGLYAYVIEPGVVRVGDKVYIS